MRIVRFAAAPAPAAPEPPEAPAPAERRRADDLADVYEPPPVRTDAAALGGPIEVTAPAWPAAFAPAPPPGLRLSRSRSAAPRIPSPRHLYLEGEVGSRGAAVEAGFGRSGMQGGLRYEARDGEQRVSLELRGTFGGAPRARPEERTERGLARASERLAALDADLAAASPTAPGFLDRLRDLGEDAISRLTEGALALENAARGPVSDEARRRLGELARGSSVLGALLDAPGLARSLGFSSLEALLDGLWAAVDGVRENR